MGTPEWDGVTWEAFVGALSVYKQRYSGKSGQDLAYVRCLTALEGLSIMERAERAVDIVTFLNSWAARVSRTETPLMLGAWIRECSDRLERLAGLSIGGAELAGRGDEIHALYGSLMTAGRAMVRNWSDAANSKALHQVVPAVFVMWDNKIKQFAPDYGDFIQHMQRLARRLIHDSPYSREQMETELQARLGYSARKPLAKYLDEFNVAAAARTPV